MHVEDTITAICTPAGNSALGVIRISGRDAFTLLAGMFESPESGKSGRRVEKGRLKVSLCNEETYAPAMVCFMPGPKSYTCEDIAEIYLPGSRPLLSAVLQGIISAGARQAEAGEFTLRAFLNGRIDLSQAEAVERVVAAGSEADRREALQRLRGRLSEDIQKWREKIISIAGMLEAVIDFEEEDTGDALPQSIYDDIEKIAFLCEETAKKAKAGALYKNGIPVIFAGATNAGKSTLINALLGKEASIVSPENSTTRDRLSYELSIERFKFLLEDCPGLDAESSLIARAATEAAKQAVHEFPLVMLLVDISSEINDELKEFICSLPRTRVILVYNKSDLPEHEGVRQSVMDAITLNRHINLAAECNISALAEYGIDKIKNALINEAMGDVCLSGGGLTLRESIELVEAASCCREALQHLEHSPEIAAFELRGAYNSISRAVGEGYAEDILENIFSHFCIGK